MNKRLSIIVPFYKTLELTKELLSVLMPQLNENTELIIVDDGCNELELDNYNRPNVLIIHKQNGGVSSARNKGLEIADGQYIAFIDSDDLVREDYVEQILKAIETGLPHYKMSWESFGINQAYYHAENLPNWNCSIWCRVFRKDTIIYNFKENMKACEDKQFLIDNGFIIEDGKFVKDTNNFETGYIDKAIYKYNSGRIGSLSNLYL